jgi:hypothetical protein
MINAVLILANGTVPRLTTSTDYALSTLSAIFPRSLADNIGFLFTQVPNPLSWNFSPDCIPASLTDAPQFKLDNPFALQRKYLQLRTGKHKNPKSGGNLKQLQAIVTSGEDVALSMLVELFDWLDGLAPQPTRDILDLYQQSQNIETKMQNILSKMDQSAQKKRELENTLVELESTESVSNLTQA